jgi:hypothetical protein
LKAVSPEAFKDPRAVRPGLLLGQKLSSLASLGEGRSKAGSGNLMKVSDREERSRFRVGVATTRQDRAMTVVSGDDVLDARRSWQASSPGCAGGRHGVEAVRRADHPGRRRWSARQSDRA